MGGSRDPNIIDTAPVSARGGAIALQTGTFLMDHCQVVSNSVTAGNGGGNNDGTYGEGGGIYNNGNLQLLNCTFFGNSSISGEAVSPKNKPGQGGGIYNTGSCFISSCLLLENSTVGSHDRNGTTDGDGLGGAIYNESTLRIINSTITANSAIGGSQSSYVGSAWGGGAYNDQGDLTLVNSSIANNSSIPGQVVSGTHPGAGYGANIANTNGVLTLKNTILAYGGTPGNAWGSITDGGHNISSDASAAFNSGTSFNQTDPRLGTLGDNGGPTQTLPLLANSPAIDFGTADGAPATDQRGYARPAGAGVDIGAFEYGAVPATGQPPSLLLLGTSPDAFLQFRADAGTTYELQDTQTLQTWTTQETIGPFTSPTNIVRAFPTTSQPTRFLRVKVP